MGEQSSSLGRIVIRTRFSFFRWDEAEETCIPVLENSYFKLSVTFYEDVPGGRLLRPIVLVDRFGVLNLFERVTVKGKRGYGVIEEGFEEIKRIAARLRVPTILHPAVPVIFDIEKTESEEDTRTSRGLANAISSNPRLIDELRELFRNVKLEVKIV